MTVKHRPITSTEIALAKKLRREGLTFTAIARRLGRRHGDGIRRHLDKKHRDQRNAFQASYMRKFRAQRASPQ